MQPKLTDTVLNGLKEMALNRRATYSVLSRMWDEPDRELLEDFFGAGGALTQLQFSLDRMNPRLTEFQEGLRLMSGFLDLVLMELNEEREKSLTDWRVEYARLFIGPGWFPCPPYESAYREKQEDGSFGNLMGESTLEVRKLYQKAGLDVGTKQLPDYHCVELEFMSYLIGQEAEQYLAKDREGARNWQDLQEMFLKEHIELWLPEFCKDVERETNLSYYKGLSKITAAYINLEADRINGLKKLL
ncbi:TorD/DmsD family molecular chaperone [Zhaonella formicivorans]|uniref:TorD/DmsD family molecular chaperone n=1 Tax=Zhaonella formicivorans TaxID=2528593 RepID=UPI0010D2D4E1|nr:molecular chaperone TorD family protein [Zhaonella formicivorans]